MRYSKKDQLLCFTIDEIKKIYIDEKKKQIDIYLLKSGVSVLDLSDSNKRDEISSKMSKCIKKSKEEVEIFCAAYLLEEFHTGNPHVCFYMKDSFLLRKENLITFDFFKRNIKENSLVDFLFFNGTEVRAIQFKQYRNRLNTDDLLDFISRKIDHYCCNLGQINLLIMLQSPNGDISDLDFKKLNMSLINKGLNFEGEILLSYNLQNKKSVISRVYPTIAHKISPFKL